MTTPRGTRGTGRTSLLAVVATGTQRDLYPYIALALALQRSGFGVRLCTHQCHAAFVARFGLPLGPLKGDPAALLRSTAFRDAVSTGSPLTLAALLLREDQRGRELNFSFVHAATKDVDGILCGITLLTECTAGASSARSARARPLHCDSRAVLASPSPQSRRSTRSHSCCARCCRTAPAAR